MNSQEAMISQCLRIIESQAELIKFLTQQEEERSNSEAPSEMQEMFDEEVTRRNRTPEEIRDIGKKIGTEPVRFPSRPGGGYVTTQEVENLSQQVKGFKKLSRADELDIIRSFEHIKGQNYWNALGFVEEQGYALHPVYINGEKFPADLYSGTTLGVAVKDPNFEGEKISEVALITDIVDVGGKDQYNRGSDL